MHSSHAPSCVRQQWSPVLSWAGLVALVAMGSACAGKDHEAPKLRQGTAAAGLAPGWHLLSTSTPTAADFLKPIPPDRLLYYAVDHDYDAETGKLATRYTSKDALTLNQTIWAHVLDETTSNEQKRKPPEFASDDEVDAYFVKPHRSMRVHELNAQRVYRWDAGKQTTVLMAQDEGLVPGEAYWAESPIRCRPEGWDFQDAVRVLVGCGIEHAAFEVISRSAWSARELPAPIVSQRGVPLAPKLVLQHTGTTQDVSILDLESQAMDSQGQEDLGSHFIIAKDAQGRWQVYEGRPIVKATAHIEISIAGTYEAVDSDRPETQAGHAPGSPESGRQPPPGAAVRLLQLAAHLSRSVPTITGFHPYGQGDNALFPGASLSPGEGTLHWVWAISDRFFGVGLGSTSGPDLTLSAIEYDKLLGGQEEAEEEDRSQDDRLPPFLHVVPEGQVVVSSDPEFRVEGVVFDENLLEVSLGGVVLGNTNQSFSNSVWLHPGRNDIRISAVDAFGNVAQHHKQVIYDREAPIIVVSPPDRIALSQKKAVILGGTVTDASLQTLTVNDEPIKVRGETFGVRVDVASLSPGLHVYRLEADDVAGFTTSKRVGFLVDDHGVKFLPRLPSDEDEDQGADGVASDVHLGVHADVVANMEGTNLMIVLEDETGTTEDVALQSLVDGGAGPRFKRATLFFEDLTKVNKDAIKRLSWSQVTPEESEVSVHFSFFGPGNLPYSPSDAVYPMLSLSYPTDLVSYTNVPLVRVDGSAQDEHLMFVRINEVITSTTSGAFSSFVKLEEEQTDLEVVARDLAGLEVSAKRTIVYDPEPPVLSLSSGPERTVYEAKYTLEGFAEDAHLSGVTIRNRKASEEEAVELTEGRFSHALTLDEGENVFSVVATDAAGNVTSQSVKLTREKTFFATQATLPPKGLYAWADGKDVSLRWRAVRHYADGTDLPEGVKPSFRVYRDEQPEGDVPEIYYEGQVPNSPQTYLFHVVSVLKGKDGVEYVSGPSDRIDLEVGGEVPVADFGEPEGAAEVTDGGLSAAMPEVVLNRAHGKVFAHMAYIVRGERDTQDQVRYGRSDDHGRPGSFTMATEPVGTVDSEWVITDIAIAAHEQKVVIGWIEQEKQGLESRIAIRISDIGGQITPDGNHSFKAERSFPKTPVWKRDLSMAYDHTGTHHMIWNESSKVYYMRNFHGEEDAHGNRVNVFDEQKRRPNHELVKYNHTVQVECDGGGGGCCTEDYDDVYSLGVEAKSSDPQACGRKSDCSGDFGVYLTRTEETYVENPSLHVGPDSITIVGRQTRKYDNLPTFNSAWSGLNSTFYGPNVPPPRLIKCGGKNPFWFYAGVKLFRQGFRQTKRDHQYACAPEIPENQRELLALEGNFAAIQHFGYDRTNYYSYDGELGHDDNWWQYLELGIWHEEDKIKVAQRPIRAGAWSDVRKEERVEAKLYAGKGARVHFVEAENRVEKGFRQGAWERRSLPNVPPPEPGQFGPEGMYEETLLRWRISTVDEFGCEREGEYQECGSPTKNRNSGPVGPTYAKAHSGPEGQMVVTYELGKSKDPNSGGNAILFAMSPDGGKTWKPAKEIGQGYMPSVGVTRRGEIGVLYYKPDPAFPSNQGPLLGQVVLARSFDGSDFDKTIVNEGFEERTAQTRVFPAKPIHWRIYGAEADYLHGVPSLATYENLWLASFIKYPDDEGDRDRIMVNRVSAPDGSHKRVLASAPQESTANQSIETEFECVDEYGALSTGCSLDATSLAFGTRAFSNVGEFGDELNGSKTVWVPLTGGYGATQETVSIASGAGSLASGEDADDAQSVEVTTELFRGDAAGNYKKATIIRDKLFSVALGGQREYIPDEDLPDDTPFLALYERAWAYTQGIALAQFARQGDPRTTQLARYICSEDIAVWVEDEKTGERYIRGWHFSWNTKNDSWKDARQVTGANAWVLHGLGAYMSSDEAEALDAGSRDELLGCYLAAISGLSRHLAGDLVSDPEAKWLMTAGTTARGLKYSEEPWHENLGLTEEVLGVPKDPSGKRRRRIAYYDVLDVIGYGSLRPDRNPKITTYFRDANGDKTDELAITLTNAHHGLFDAIRVPERAVNVVTEHNLDTLSVLNHAIHKWDQITRTMSEADKDKIGRLPNVPNAKGLAGLIMWRDGLRDAIFTKLWNDDFGRVVTGGEFIDGVFHASELTAIDNCSWLSLSVDYGELPAELRQKLASCLDYTIKSFTSSGLTFRGEKYHGAFYFPNSFKDPYIEQSNDQEELYHLEATTGLILGLLYFGEKMADEFPEDAERFLDEAARLWSDMQRFLAHNGAPYSTVRIQDLMTQLQSSTAAIWYIDVYDYYSAQYGDVDQPLKNYAHGPLGFDADYEVGKARAWPKEAWAKLKGHKDEHQSLVPKDIITHFESTVTMTTGLTNNLPGAREEYQVVRSSTFEGSGPDKYIVGYEEGASVDFLGYSPVNSHFVRVEAWMEQRSEGLIYVFDGVVNGDLAGKYLMLTLMRDGEEHFVGHPVAADGTFHFETRRPPDEPEEETETEDEAEDAVPVVPVGPDLGDEAQFRASYPILRVMQDAETDDDGTKTKVLAVTGAPVDARKPGKKQSSLGFESIYSYAGNPGWWALHENAQGDTFKLVHTGSGGRPEVVAVAHPYSDAAAPEAPSAPRGDAGGSEALVIHSLGRSSDLLPPWGTANIEPGDTSFEVRLGSKIGEGVHRIAKTRPTVVSQASATLKSAFDNRFFFVAPVNVTDISLNLTVANSPSLLGFLGKSVVFSANGFLGEPHSPENHYVTISVVVPGDKNENREWILGRAVLAENGTFQFKQKTTPNPLEPDFSEGKPVARLFRKEDGEDLMLAATGFDALSLEEEKEGSFLSPHTKRYLTEGKRGEWHFHELHIKEDLFGGVDEVVLIDRADETQPVAKVQASDVAVQTTSRSPRAGLFGEVSGERLVSETVTKGDVPAGATCEDIGGSCLKSSEEFSTCESRNLSTVSASCPGTAPLCCMEPNDAKREVAITYLEDQALAIVAAVNHGDLVQAAKWVDGMLSTAVVFSATPGEPVQLPYAVETKSGKALGPYFQTGSQMLAAYSVLWYLKEVPSSVERSKVVGRVRVLLESMIDLHYVGERKMFSMGLGDPSMLAGLKAGTTSVDDAGLTKTEAKPKKATTIAQPVYLYRLGFNFKRTSRIAHRYPLPPLLGALGYETGFEPAFETYKDYRAAWDAWQAAIEAGIEADLASGVLTAEAEPQIQALRTLMEGVPPPPKKFDKPVGTTLNPEFQAVDMWWDADVADAVVALSQLADVAQELSDVDTPAPNGGSAPGSISLKDVVIPDAVGGLARFDRAALEDHVYAYFVFTLAQKTIDWGRSPEVLESLENTLVGERFWDGPGSFGPGEPFWGNPVAYADLATAKAIKGTNRGALALYTLFATETGRLRLAKRSLDLLNLMAFDETPKASRGPQAYSELIALEILSKRAARVFDPRQEQIAWNDVRETSAALSSSSSVRDWAATMIVHEPRGFLGVETNAMFGTGQPPRLDDIEIIDDRLEEAYLSALFALLASEPRPYVFDALLTRLVTIDFATEAVATGLPMENWLERHQEDFDIRLMKTNGILQNFCNERMPKVVFQDNAGEDMAKAIGLDCSAVSEQFKRLLIRRVGSDDGQLFVPLLQHPDDAYELLRLMDYIYAPSYDRGEIDALYGTWLAEFRNRYATTLALWSRASTQSSFAPDASAGKVASSLRSFAERALWSGPHQGMLDLFNAGMKLKYELRGVDFIQTINEASPAYWSREAMEARVLRQFNGHVTYLLDGVKTVVERQPQETFSLARPEKGLSRGQMAENVRQLRRLINLESEGRLPQAAQGAGLRTDALHFIMRTGKLRESDFDQIARGLGMKEDEAQLTKALFVFSSPSSPMWNLPDETAAQNPFDLLANLFKNEEFRLGEEELAEVVPEEIDLALVDAPAKVYFIPTSTVSEDGGPPCYEVYRFNEGVEELQIGESDLLSGTEDDDLHLLDRVCGRDQSPYVDRSLATDALQGIGGFALGATFNPRYAVRRADVPWSEGFLTGYAIVPPIPGINNPQSVVRLVGGETIDLHAWQGDRGAPAALAQPSLEADILTVEDKELAVITFAQKVEDCRRVLMMPTGRIDFEDFLLADEKLLADNGVNLTCFTGSEFSHNISARAPDEFPLTFVFVSSKADMNDWPDAVLSGHVVVVSVGDPPSPIDPANRVGIDVALAFDLETLAAMAHSLDIRADAVLDDFTQKIIGTANEALSKARMPLELHLGSAEVFPGLALSPKLALERLKEKGSTELFEWYQETHADVVVYVTGERGAHAWLPGSTGLNNVSTIGWRDVLGPEFLQNIGTHLGCAEAFDESRSSIEKSGFCGLKVLESAPVLAAVNGLAPWFEGAGSGLAFAPDEGAFQVGKEGLTKVLRNDSDKPIVWTAEIFDVEDDSGTAIPADSAILTVSPSSGTVDPGASETLNFVRNDARLSTWAEAHGPGPYLQRVVFSSLGGLGGQISFVAEVVTDTQKRPLSEDPLYQASNKHLAFEGVLEDLVVSREVSGEGLGKRCSSIAVKNHTKGQGHTYQLSSIQSVDAGWLGIHADGVLFRDYGPGSTMDISVCATNIDHLPKGADAWFSQVLMTFTNVSNGDVVTADRWVKLRIQEEALVVPLAVDGTLKVGANACRDYTVKNFGDQPVTWYATSNQGDDVVDRRSAEVGVTVQPTTPQTLAPRSQDVFTVCSQVRDSLLGSSDNAQVFSVGAVAVVNVTDSQTQEFAVSAHRDGLAAYWAFDRHLATEGYDPGRTGSAYFAGPTAPPLLLRSVEERARFHSSVEPFVVMAWVQPNAAVTGTSFFVSSAFQGSGWSVGLDAEGRLVFRMEHQQTMVEATSDRSVRDLALGNDAAWVHVSVAWDGREATLRLATGDEAHSKTETLFAGEGVPFMSGALSLAGSGAGENRVLFEGGVDELRIYRGALGEAEIFDEAGLDNTGAILSDLVGFQECGGGRKLSKAITRGFWSYEVLPNVINNDGSEPFYVEVRVPTQAPKSLEVQLKLAEGISGPNGPGSVVVFSDDGVGRDHTADDNVYVAGPLHYVGTPESHFGGDRDGPEGLSVQNVGEISASGEFGTFETQPSIGLIAPEVAAAVAPTIQQNAKSQLGRHFVNLCKDEGTIQSELREVGFNPTRLGKAFYASGMRDNFQFLVGLSTYHVEKIGVKLGTNRRAGNTRVVRSDGEGIDLPGGAIDVGTSYGSGKSLQALTYIDVLGAGINSYRVTHELMHLWGAYWKGAVLVDGDEVVLTDGAHLLQNVGVPSLLKFQATEFNDLGNGQVEIECTSFSQATLLDQYLMGLVSAEDAGSIPVLVGPAQKSACGAKVSGTVRQVSVADHIVPRWGRPSAARSLYRIAFVGETLGRFMTSREIAFYEALAAHYTQPVPGGWTPALTNTNWVSVDSYFPPEVRFETALQGNLNAVPKPTTPIVADTPNGLVGHWSFNQGLNVDQSYLNHKADVAGEQVPGRGGSALKGTLTVQSPALRFDKDDAFMVSLWVWPDASTKREVLIGNLDPTRALNGIGAAGLQGWEIVRESNGLVTVRTTDGNGRSNTNLGARLKIGAWNHIVWLVRQGDETTHFEVYVDATQTDRSQKSKSEVADFGSSQPILLGDGFTGSAFTGVVDELKFYRGTYDQEDVAKLYEDLSPIPKTSKLRVLTLHLDPNRPSSDSKDGVTVTHNGENQFEFVFADEMRAGSVIRIPNGGLRPEEFPELDPFVVKPFVLAGSRFAGRFVDFVQGSLTSVSYPSWMQSASASPGDALTYVFMPEGDGLNDWSSALHAGRALMVNVALYEGAEKEREPVEIIDDNPLYAPIKLYKPGVDFEGLPDEWFEENANIGPEHVLHLDNVQPGQGIAVGSFSLTNRPVSPKLGGGNLTEQVANDFFWFGEARSYRAEVELPTPRDGIHIPEWIAAVKFSVTVEPRKFEQIGFFFDTDALAGFEGQTLVANYLIHGLNEDGEIDEANGRTFYRQVKVTVAPKKAVVRAPVFAHQVTNWSGPAGSYKILVEGPEDLEKYGKILLRPQREVVLPKGGTGSYMLAVDTERVRALDENDVSFTVMYVHTETGERFTERVTFTFDVEAVLAPTGPVRALFRDFDHGRVPENWTVFSAPGTGEKALDWVEGSFALTYAQAVLENKTSSYGGMWSRTHVPSVRASQTLSFSVKSETPSGVGAEVAFAWSEASGERWRSLPMVLTDTYQTMVLAFPDDFVSDGLEEETVEAKLNDVPNPAETEVFSFVFTAGEEDRTNVRFAIDHVTLHDESADVVAEALGGVRISPPEPEPEEEEEEEEKPIIDAPDVVMDEVANRPKTISPPHFVLVAQSITYLDILAERALVHAQYDGSNSAGVQYLIESAWGTLAPDHPLAAFSTGSPKDISLTGNIPVLKQLRAVTAAEAGQTEEETEVVWEVLFFKDVVTEEIVGQLPVKIDLKKVGRASIDGTGEDGELIPDQLFFNDFEPVKGCDKEVCNGEWTIYPIADFDEGRATRGLESFGDGRRLVYENSALTEIGALWVPFEEDLTLYEALSFEMQAPDYSDARAVNAGCVHLRIVEEDGDAWVSGKFNIPVSQERRITVLMSDFTYSENDITRATNQRPNFTKIKTLSFNFVPNVDPGKTDHVRYSIDTLTGHGQLSADQSRTEPDCETKHDDFEASQTSLNLRGDPRAIPEIRDLLKFSSTFGRINKQAQSRTMYWSTKDLHWEPGDATADTSLHLHESAHSSVVKTVAGIVHQVTHDAFHQQGDYRIPVPCQNARRGPCPGRPAESERQWRENAYHLWLRAEAQAVLNSLIVMKEIEAVPSTGFVSPKLAAILNLKSGPGGTVLAAQEAFDAYWKGGRSRDEELLRTLMGVVQWQKEQNGAVLRERFNETLLNLWGFGTEPLITESENPFKRLSEINPYMYTRDQNDGHYDRNDDPRDQDRFWYREVRLPHQGVIRVQYDDFLPEVDPEDGKFRTCGHVQGSPVPCSSAGVVALDPRPRQAISFSGYDFFAKRSSEPIAPGPNRWSDSFDNIFVDDEGLHLRVTEDPVHKGIWYAAEVIADRNLGYGQYWFTVEYDIKTQPQNVVFGLFLWDPSPKARKYENREIDIEFSRWLKPDRPFGQFAVPPYEEGMFERFEPLEAALRQKDNISTYVMDWQKDRILFRGYYGSDAKGEPFVEWIYDGDRIQEPGEETVRMNLWIYGPDETGDLKPVDDKPAEAIIKRFEHKRARLP